MTLRKVLSNKKYLLIAFLLIFSGIGLISLLLSHAATPALGVEAEVATGAGVQLQADSNASGGSYVQFGSTPSFSIAKTLVNDHKEAVLFWDQQNLPSITGYEIWRDGAKVGNISSSQVAQNTVGSNVGAGVVGILDSPDAKGSVASLSKMKSAGFGWTRIDMNWWTGEGNGKGEYIWLPQNNPYAPNPNPFDVGVARATAANMKLIGLVAYTPPWARPASWSTMVPDPSDSTKSVTACSTNSACSGGHVPPADMNDYVNYVKALVNRYGPNCGCANPVRVWEIWNEQNITGFWQDSYFNQSVNPANYLNMLKVVYPAIKAADPGATVLTGGFSPSGDTGGSLSPATYLNNLYAAINPAIDSNDYFDAVGLHPYSGNISPLHDPTTPPENYPTNWNTFLQTRYLSYSMIANSDETKKIWATESGWPTASACGSFSKTEQEQSDYAVESIYNWYQFAVNGPNIFYVYKDYPQGTNCDPYVNYGFTTLSGTDKLAVSAITRVNKQLVFIDPTTPTTGTFNYQIKAVNAAGQSAVSNVASVTVN